MIKSIVNFVKGFFKPRNINPRNKTIFVALIFGEGKFDTCPQCQNELPDRRLDATWEQINITFDDSSKKYLLSTYCEKCGAKITGTISETVRLYYEPKCDEEEL